MKIRKEKARKMVNKKLKFLPFINFEMFVVI